MSIALFVLLFSTAAPAAEPPLQLTIDAALARVDALRARLNRTGAASLIAPDVPQVIDAFASLYLAQQQEKIVGTLNDSLNELEARSEKLLESGDVSNITALERREAALAVRSEMLDIEGRRLAADAQLRRLIHLDNGVLDNGVLDNGALDPAVDIQPLVDLTAVPESVAALPATANQSFVEESRARLREAEAGRRPRVTLSGYGGIGTAQSNFRSESSEGSFGVYGVRINFILPLFDRATQLSIVEARAQEAEAVAAVQPRPMAGNSLLLPDPALIAKRIELLRESATVAAEREASLARLVDAGVRPEGDLFRARYERVHRELDLLAAQLQSWKELQLRRHLHVAELP
jgi:hypothetical protein